MTLTLIEQREAAVSEARAIAEGAKAAGRDLTTDEIGKVNEKLEAVKGLDAKIVNAKASDDLMSRITAIGGDPAGKNDDEPGSGAKSIGEHFKAQLAGRDLKKAARSGWSTTEFKAATDTQTVGSAGGAYGPLITDIDRSFVLPYQRPLVIADLMDVGTLSGNAITYPVYGLLEGGSAWTAEGGHKGQLHLGDPTWVTDALGEVAGFFKITDDMAEDIPYVVSEIEGSARYDLLLKEEVALLSGNGTAPNLRGILNRSGIQTETQAATGDSAQDAIFRAITKVQTGTGRVADGIAINPIDYQALRLAKDANQQYYGGGFFAGQYGTGGIALQPPLWGLSTVVTAAVPAKTVVVGAWKSAKVFRKGGLRVESTNSNVDDFENDKITIRLRERLGLQAKFPSAFVKVTLV